MAPKQLTRHGSFGALFDVVALYSIWLPDPFDLIPSLHEGECKTLLELPKMLPNLRAFAVIKMC